MKSLLHWSTALSIFGSVVVGTLLGQGLEALALPEEQVLQKLSPIPVFTVADAQGAPLVVTGENGAKVSGVFISQQAANQFVEQLQAQDPEIASQVQVVPVPLGQVYKLNQQNEGQEDGLNFTYVPIQEEVEQARQLLSEDGKEYGGGVPLFIAKGGEEEGYLMIEQNNQQVIPLFFEREQLQQMIERFQEQDPELASTVDVEVVLLENVIASLQSKDDEFLNKVVLVPSQESLEFLRSNAQQEQPSQAQ